MSRIVIDFPKTLVFVTEIDIHSSYINRGNHVGNSRYVDLCNETSLRFFASKNVTEYLVGEQVLLNSEFSVQLKSEAKFSDRLKVELAVNNFHRCGCDFLFRFSQISSGKDVALARFSFLTFDYKLSRVTDAAAGFADFFV